MISDEENLDPLTPKQERIRKRYEGMYAGLGAGIFAFRPYAGMVLIQSANARSDELIRAARHNPIVWKWLEYFANSSDSFNFIVGHGVMLWAILSEMGRLHGNPAIFKMAGLSIEQVMSSPPGMPEMSQEEMNAYTAAASFNGHSGN